MATIIGLAGWAYPYWRSLHYDLHCTIVMIYQGSMIPFQVIMCKDGLPL